MTYRNKNKHGEEFNAVFAGVYDVRKVAENFGHLCRIQGVTGKEHGLRYESK